MNNLQNMVWIESLKALRSRMPLWTGLASILMPLGMAFLVFVSKNPEISKNLGLISAKADLVAFAATDWATYLTVFSQLIAAAGFFFFVLVVSWVFGREFADGTLKDLLAVPVQRGAILMAKFIVAAVWSVGIAIVIVVAGLLMGVLIGLPGGSTQTLVAGSTLVAITAGLVIATALPFALLASVGRGYLLPIGLAVLILMLTNVLVIAGWGEYFPWAIPGLFSLGNTPLTAASYWIVLFTLLAGILATYAWWKRADQNR